MTTTTSTRTRKRKNSHPTDLAFSVDHEQDGWPYRILEDNPFVNIAGARGEIWAHGFRNPWKITFDRATGDLWLCCLSDSR